MTATVSGVGTRPSAVQIAEALGQPTPTVEQQAVIEAPLSPLLVVAGAGSGKTETMAARVVWLVAGGDVRPEEVLGLTFTRKAAAELAERVRRRLRRLRSTGLWTPGRPAAPSAAAESAGDDVAAGDVTVSTYHAYAGRIVGEHGLRLGIEAESQLLSEAACWQLASEVVERWSGEMDAVDKATSTVVRAVLTMAGECAEHLLEPEDVDRWLASRIAALEALPYNDKKADGRYAPIRDLLTDLRARRQVVPLVRAYVDAKRARDSVDFGDQLALAARLAESVGPLVASERVRYRAVLLDEFQDTSHAQLTMLRALFGDGHGVTAVGDPHQSIYGWRGASAGTLARFARRFTDAEGQPAAVLPLSTSWRNDEAVLAVANTVAEPLRADRTVPVEVLHARPSAGLGQVQTRTYATLEQEAEAVADWVAAAWWADERRRLRSGRSAAVLCRKRSQFAVLEEALAERGLPVEVVGLGGLLSTPEVSDVVAALHVVHDPSRGDQLMRLLTGPAVRLGPRDVVALGGWSRELHRRRSGGASGAPSEAVDEASLVEALDDLPPDGWRDAEGRGLSQEGRRRLARLAGTVRGLRGRTALPLAELAADVERALLLDVEVAARPGRAAAAARTNLDAFADVADRFSATAERPTLGAFLAWLETARDRERGLEPGLAEPDADAVQILTVHAAKGLEWDVVAVPGLVEGTFPARTATPSFDADAGWQLGPAKDRGWLADLGAVPHALRGDRDSLPDVRWDLAATQAELRDELAEYERAGGDHEIDEERRLAYVALTRSRQELLLTAHVWGEGSTPRLPSRFLDELEGHPSVTVGPRAPLPDGPEAPNPRTLEPFSRGWPFDPLGPRRQAMEAGAVAVLRELSTRPDIPRQSDSPQPVPDAAPGARRPDDVAERWSWETTALLAERDARRDSTVRVSLPTHVSASRLVRLVDDPHALALDLRRPMPQQPRPAARRGTAFHAWVEQRLRAAAIVDVLDLPGAADEDPAHEEELAAMQRTFLASEWADRPVVAVEVPIETPVDGTVVRGRVDAVLARPDGGVDVVDWKTGARPTGVAAKARAVQLAAYRLAWSRLHDVPLDQVGAAFFYVSTGETVRPVDLLDERGLVELLRGLD
ncbi:MAG TPA: ATP-dependent DNA helicase [Actinomycetales bacterium]|nr:ATP-dependent DNA helicase [Actinomycetales bacterium]